METEWYYTRAGKQFGPVNTMQMKQLATEGGLGAHEMVWNPSMTGWVAAGRVQELTSQGPGAAAGGPPPEPTAGIAPATGVQSAAAPTEVLGYEAPGSEATQVTTRSLELLRLTRPWVLTMAILLFIGVGFMVIGGVALLIMSAVGGTRVRMGLGLGLLYLALAAVFGAPPIFLAKYFSRIGKLLRLRRAVDLEQALEAQKSYWKCVAIMTIAFVALYIVAVVVVIVVRL